jgi:hypothetical protein
VLGGLPSNLDPRQQLEFDPNNLDELKYRLSLVMPWFRESIKRRNTEYFYENLETLIVKSLAFFGGVVLVSGIIGTFLKK